MKATLKTLLTALLGVAVLGVGANAYADGRGDRDGRHDGWRGGERYEHRWDGHHDQWRHHHRYHHPVYRKHVYFYTPAPVVHEHRHYYGPTTYRYPGGASVIIDLSPIIIR
jgi:hypothetical protein